MSRNKYFEIYDFIKKKIKEGVYLPEEKIPSENELKDLFKVSRNTVRKAIEMLSSDGYLTSVHGKGVFVIKKIPVNFLISGTQSFKEASITNDLKYQTTVPIFEVITVDEEISKMTDFNVGEEIYHIVRIREIDGEKVILDDNYFLKSVLEGITVSIAMDSIYEFLEKRKNIKIEGTQKVISVELATEEDKKYLDLNQKNLLAVVKNFAYLQSGILFEYTESRHRYDKFVFSSYAKR